MNFYHVLAVGLGGFFGSIARYGSVVLLERRITTAFPYPTFLVNVVGSFLLGAFAGYCVQHHKGDSFRLFLTTGFCGGFTTFSTFAVENLNLLQQKMNGTSLLYIILSVTCSVIAALLGFWFSKSLS